MDKNLSNLVRQQFPHYMKKESGNMLITLLELYYQWLYENSNDIQTVTDIDSAGIFLDEFIKETMADIPYEIKANRTLLAKHIKDLYQSKGTEPSIKLLFRLLFDEDIELFYPKEFILKTSDGRWTIEKSVRISTPITGDITDLEGNMIYGQTSGTSARVERIVSTQELGIPVYELYLSDLDGTFLESETVGNSDFSVSGTVFAVVGPMGAINVIDGGAYHTVGDTVNYSQLVGSGADGQVLATTDKSALEFTIVDGGSGYTVGNPISVVSGGSGANASFIVTGISNTELLSVNTDTIEPFANATLDNSPYFISGGANTSNVSATMSTANISSVLSDVLEFSDVTAGTISEIQQFHGYGYSTLPDSVTVFDPIIIPSNFDDGNGGIKGNNATVTADNAPGAITSASVVAKGTSYNRNKVAVIENVTRDAANGGGEPVVEGTVIYPGRYTDTYGWLSWNCVLQDSDYYQQFSYVIKSQQFVDEYRDVVKKLVHPAGFKFFGQFEIVNEQHTNGVIVLPKTTIQLNTITTISDPVVESTIDIT